MDQQSGTHAQKGDLEVTGVSRSGRVRKKSSKLMDFQSPDEIETRTKKTALTMKQQAITKNQQLHQQQFSNNFSAAPSSPNYVLHSIQHQGGKTGNDHSTSYDSGVAIKTEDDLMSPMDYQDGQDESEELESDDDEMYDNENDEGGESVVDPTVRQSIYMSEKSNKKKVMIDGKMVYGKAQRKDKGKARFTAYMLWARDARKQMLAQQPDLDFGSISRRLGEMWANVPMSEKLNWKRRLKRYISKPKPIDKKPTANASSKFLNKGQNAGSTPQTPKTPKTSKTPGNSSSSLLTDKNHPPNATGNNRTRRQVQHDFSNPNSPDHQTIVQNKKSNNANVNKVSPTPIASYKVTGIEPVDVAAHLKLLGDSLTIIGERLKEHEGQITVSGSLSVLLDSLLCSLGPLMCLTTQIPGFNEKNLHLRDTLHDTLDNIAYVMPGL